MARGRGATATAATAQLAEVDHEGNVYWVRQGLLQVLCKFSDVVNFPEDEPSCNFEMGGLNVAMKRG